MSTRKGVNLNSRCELIRNPRKKAVANRNAASTAGAFPSGLPKTRVARALRARFQNAVGFLRMHGNRGRYAPRNRPRG